jgi:hypothetical protein
MQHWRNEGIHIRRESPIWTLDTRGWWVRLASESEDERRMCTGLVDISLSVEP